MALKSYERTIRLTQDQKKWLELRALEQAYVNKSLTGISISAIICEAVDFYILNGDKMQLRPDGKEARKTEAIERKKMSDTLTPGQRLEALDAKLGVGVGAKKERARLGKVAPAATPSPKKAKKGK